ncbi:hypothetical protein [Chamaesiphon sp. VAR_48_metabat_135_sub]|uniref:hypothetical protein n=1 Tax=Chamaesiphon sp. VAR_48_metabat_135_sub TaxID=2964699 RepID=UPI00286BD758|nr:hypothetical protein [Chamaesiphon sp. VAR_48_metabat_135_sub]
MKNISTLLSIFAGMTVFIHIAPAKAELAPGITFDRLISFNSKLVIKDRLKEFDKNQDFSNFLSYSNSPIEGAISLSEYYPIIDNSEVFNAFTSKTTSF